MLTKEHRRNVVLASLFAVVLALAALAVVQIESPPPHQRTEARVDDHGKADRKRSITQKPSLIQNGISTERRYDHSSDNPPQSKQEDPPKWTDVIVAWFTVIVAAANSILTGLVVWQIFEARRASQRQAEEVQQQIGIARDATKAAMLQAQSFLSTERPFLLINRVEYSIKDPWPSMVMKEHPGAVCLVKNFGRTPAIVLDAGCLIRTTKEDFPGGIPSFFGTPLSGSHIRILESNGEIKVPAVLLDSEVIDAPRIRNLQDSFWLHFCFVYADASGVRHKTIGKWKFNYLLDVWDGNYKEIT